MRTVRQDLQDLESVGQLQDGALAALEQLECRVWRKWDELRKQHRILQLLSGTIESKVLRPILGERPAGCP